MGDEPVCSPLHEDHGKARRSRHRVAILNGHKLVETDAKCCGIAESYHMALADCDLVTAAWQPSEILTDLGAALVERGTRCSMQQRVRRVELCDSVSVIGRVCGGPAVDDRARVLRWASPRLARQAPQ